MSEAEKPKLTLRDILSLLRQSDENPEILDSLDLSELTRDKVPPFIGKCSYLLPSGGPNVRSREA